MYDFGYLGLVIAFDLFKTPTSIPDYVLFQIISTCRSFKTGGPLEWGKSHFFNFWGASPASVATGNIGQSKTTVALWDLQRGFKKQRTHNLNQEIWNVCQSLAKVIIYMNLTSSIYVLVASRRCNLWAACLDILFRFGHVVWNVTLSTINHACCKPHTSGPVDPIAAKTNLLQCSIVNAQFGHRPTKPPSSYYYICIYIYMHVPLKNPYLPFEESVTKPQPTQSSHPLCIHNQFAYFCNFLSLPLPL